MKEPFDKEVEGLVRYSDSSISRRLIRPLFTYQYKGHYHLVFWWAVGTLWDYWTVNPMPRLSITTGLWFAKQVLGIVCALGQFNETQTPLPAGGGMEIMYGRHGDLKPDNDLWFTHEDSTPDRRRSEHWRVHGADARSSDCLISDSGLTSFHRRASSTRTRSRTRSVPCSPTYRAPEFDLDPDQLVSQSSDIWSLGCLLLEFSIWLLGGWDLLESFSKQRLEDDESGIKEDKFFIVTTVDITLNTEHRDYRQAFIKPCIFEVSVPSSFCF